MLKGISELPGIAKGITFSPDGTCLLVTFCDINSLVIYNLLKKTKRIEQLPRQIIQGKDTEIYRPEDLAISPNGDYCAISNSEQNTVSFYSFDKSINRITKDFPSYILQNPHAGFCFPHGITFSSDRSLLLVTEFGRVGLSMKVDILWDDHRHPKESKCHIYSLT